MEDILKSQTGLIEARDHLDVVQVYRENADFVWRTLQRMGIEEASLDDVAQEVFVVVHRKLGTFDGTSKMTTWLYGICLRVASSWRKRAWRRRERVMADIPELPCQTNPSGEQFTHCQEARRLLRAVLDRMSIDKRVVFTMYEIEELSTSEIATVLEVPIGTVHSRLHGARKDFEALLSRMSAEKRHGGGA